MRNFIGVFLSFFVLSANASTTISVVPTSWVLSYYPGLVSYDGNGHPDASQSLAVTQVGSISTCRANGGFWTFPAGSSPDDIKSFMQIVIAAKISGNKVTIIFDEADKQFCHIEAFGLQ